MIKKYKKSHSEIWLEEFLDTLYSHMICLHPKPRTKSTPMCIGNEQRVRVRKKGLYGEGIVSITLTNYFLLSLIL